MFDCCTNNCFNSGNCNPCCNNECSPNFCNTPCSEEFPKCVGPFTEQKFSNMIPPSFLCSSTDSKSKARSCSCSSKKQKTVKNCVCKAKDCKCAKDGKKSADDDATGERSEEDQSKLNGYGLGEPPISHGGAVVSQGGTSMPQGTMAQGAMPHGAMPHGAMPQGTMPQGAMPNLGMYPNCAPGTSEYCPAPAPTPAVWNGTDGPPGPTGAEVNGYAGMNPMGYAPGNQVSQQLSDMPAAGLPSRQVPQFDPCTGREIEFRTQTALSGPFDPATVCQPTCLNPSFCPNLQYYQNDPTAQCGCNVSPPIEEGPSEASAAASTAQQPKDKNKAPKGGKEASSVAIVAQKDKLKKPNSNNNNAKSKAKSNKDSQLINGCNVSPELMERICNSLQASCPSDGGFILLPINMSSKTKKSDEPAKRAAKKTSSNSSIQKKKITSSSDESQALTKKKGKGQGEGIAESETEGEKSTRNCGCNTLISGNIDGNQAAEQQNGEQANSQGVNCCGPSCSSNPGCCYWPRYSYYYNPYTGCYCWYNPRCCYGCNGCCCNSCAMQPPANNSNSPADDSSKQLESSRKPKGSLNSKKSPKPTSGTESDQQRISAGDIAPFQPEVEELYERWKGFQQYANINANGFPSMPRAPGRPPSPTRSAPIYYRSPRFPYYPMHQQQMQMNRNFMSPPPSVQVTPQEQEATDIDWTPH